MFSVKGVCTAVAVRKTLRVFLQPGSFSVFPLDPIPASNYPLTNVHCPKSIFLPIGCGRFACHYSSFLRGYPFDMERLQPGRTIGRGSERVLNEALYHPGTSAMHIINTKAWISKATRAVHVISHFED